jgi:hypothetical protein
LLTCPDACSRYTKKLTTWCVHHRGVGTPRCIHHGAVDFLVYSSLGSRFGHREVLSPILTSIQRCPDKTSGDKTSVDKTSVDKTSVDKMSVDKTSVDKTSIATKRPSDKMSVGTKRPSDKTSGGQNIRGDKMSVGTKRPWTKHPSGSYLPGKIFTDKNLLSSKEKSANTHTLSLWEGGGKHVQYLTERSFIFIKKQFTS